MKVCKLVKIINSNCENESIFKVSGIEEYPMLFKWRYQAERFIEKNGYRYNYSEEMKPF